MTSQTGEGAHPQKTAQARSFWRFPGRTGSATSANFKNRRPACRQQVQPRFHTGEVQTPRVGSGWDVRRVSAAPYIHAYSGYGRSQVFLTQISHRSKGKPRTILEQVSEEEEAEEQTAGPAPAPASTLLHNQFPPCPQASRSSPSGTPRQVAGCGSSGARTGALLRHHSAENSTRGFRGQAIGLGVRRRGPPPGQIKQFL